MIAKNDMGEAIKRLEIALQLQKPKDKCGDATAYMQLAKAYLKSDQPNKAAQHYLPSLRMHRELNRRQMIAECLEGISGLLLSVKQSYLQNLRFLQNAKD
jgi:hypothetical protein